MDIVSYRLIKEKHLNSAFDGEGSRLYGGRWNSKGTPVVYTSDSLALCSLEIIVHLPSYQLLKKYFYIKISFDSDLISDASLADGWDSRPVSKISQSIGDKWIKEKQTPVLRVPSVLMPDGNNYLINKDHPDANKVEIGKPVLLNFDQRLKK
jgi:RES domain-containing protein